jgi:hypothetical protein
MSTFISFWISNPQQDLLERGSMLTSRQATQSQKKAGTPQPAPVPRKSNDALMKKTPVTTIIFVEEISF